ncbi:MAG: transcription antitermination factor NusB [Pseudomonadota bacterium]|nr:transcription antitermination factor NusB [Pseudomonadota bacterium]
MARKKKPEKTPEAAPPRKVRRTGSALARRSAARLAAAQLLYQKDLTGAAVEKVLSDYRDHWLGTELEGEKYVTADEELLGSIVRGVTERQADIDSMVTGAIVSADGEGGRVHLEPVLRAILRAGTWEILSCPETPTGVIINDYVDVAHGFFGGRSPSLVNAVLKRLAQTLRDSSSG